MKIFDKTKIVIKLSIFLVLSGSLLSSQCVFAVQKSRALATDSRIRVVSYQPDNVVLVRATTFTTTQIVFNKDEVIENIQNGDLAAWTVSVQKGLANMLFLKPTLLDSNTNMTVITNQHTYYFHLISGKNGNQRDNTYALHFIYPEEALSQLLANVNYNQEQKQTILNSKSYPKNYNWDYSFSGTRSIMPAHIFDDGQFTYMQLQAGQSVPAIFAVNNTSGKEAVVNYRRDGDYLIVQQIAPQFTLREGRYHVASIFNNELIHQLKVRGEG